MAKRVGLIAALPEEFRPMVRRLGLARHDSRPPSAGGAVGPTVVHAVQAGLGGHAVVAAAKALVGAQCDLLLIAGFAGALDQGLQVGDARVCCDVSTPGGERYQCEYSGTKPLARLVTSHEAIADSAGKAALRAATACDLVDMETADLAHYAATVGVDWLSVRAVSDAAGDELPAVVRVNLRPEEGRISKVRLVGQAALAPTSWGRLLGLARRSALAAKSLANMVAAVLEDLA